MKKWIFEVSPVPYVWLVRITVGAIFLSEGIQKFLFPDSVGAGRFEKIGLPMPEILGPFVGAIEIVFGALLAIGLFSRLSALPLLAVISTAICTTKIPMLVQKGFWTMAHESRTDFSMFTSLIFLIAAGGGSFSLDALLRKKKSGRWK
jgi:putative oxidoreductase